LEANELGWKVDLSPKKERLVEHLSAFGNHEGGGFLIFGVSNRGVIQGIVDQAASAIVAKIACLTRAAAELPIVIDHAMIDWDGPTLLFGHIPQSPIRPVHVRGKSIEPSFIRSGGSTRKASKQEIASLLMSSQPVRWEKLRASPRLGAEEALKCLSVATLARLLKHLCLQILTVF
jgi:ATP-dependent DNA helicase RecG